MATNHEVGGSNPPGQELKTASLTAFRKVSRFFIGVFDVAESPLSLLATSLESNSIAVNPL